jgi:hypothetical protein
MRGTEMSRRAINRDTCCSKLDILKQKSACHKIDGIEAQLKDSGWIHEMRSSKRKIF